MKDTNKSKDQLITELQQLRKKLKKVENAEIILKHNKFISTSKDNITFIDKDYLYCEVNDTYLKTNKLNRKDIVGKSVEEIFGKEIFTKHIKKNIDKCLSGNVIKYQKWFDFPKTERKYIDVAYHPFFNKNNVMLGVMVSSHDITDLKITQELLADREQKYNALIYNTQGMVYMGIPDWTKEIVGGAEEICGYPDIKLRTGQLEWKDIIYNEDREAVQLETEKLFKKAQSKICIYRIITKQGEIRWVEDRMTSFFHKQEGIYRIDGIVLDITTRKKARQSLIQNEKKLKNLNATKDKFFSIIAHDLRTPFNSMIGFSKLLINKFDEFKVSKQKEYIKYINDGLQNTNKLLENLLMWAHLQSGIIRFNPEKENLYLLAIDAIDILEQSAINKSIKIKNNLNENVILKLDKNMILTVFRNLISNAIKFTPKGGAIEIGCTIETYGRTSQQENGRTSQQENNPSVMEIYVKDNGVGISKEIQEKLFKIEENISTKGTNNETGTGLGLILCKEFIEKHGGKIWVESEEGKGSKFIFTIPV